MANIKVLPLPNWVSHSFEEDPGYLGSEKYPEITPVFNRDGWYLNRRENKAWYEVNGRAFLETTTANFKYHLNFVSIVPLSRREMEALKTVVRVSRNRSLRKEAQRVLNENSEFQSIRNIRRDYYINTMK